MPLITTIWVSSAGIYETNMTMEELEKIQRMEDEEIEKILKQARENGHLTEDGELGHLWYRDDCPHCKRMKENANP